MINLKAIATALGLGEDADEAAILAAITAQKAKGDALAATATALGVTLGDDLAAVATAAASLKAVAGTGEPDPAKYVPVETVNELRTGLASANQRLDALAAERRKAMIDAASNDGRLPPSLRKHAEKIEDEQALASFIGDLPANGLGKPAVNGGQPDGVGALTSDEFAVATAMGLSEEEFLAAKKGV
jgi:phage I-like protein